VTMSTASQSSSSISRKSIFPAGSHTSMKLIMRSVARSGNKVFCVYITPTFRLYGT
jgi:hypothetical protein